MRITRIHQTLLIAIANSKPLPSFGEFGHTALCALVDGGYATLTDDGAEYGLTDAGRDEARDATVSAAERRVSRNANARARHDAYTSVGMRRVRGGGYE